MLRARLWVRRHRHTVAFLVLGLGVAVAITLAIAHDRARDRARDRADRAQDRARVEGQRDTLRSACEDRNTRDAAVAAAIIELAHDSGTSIEPLVAALAPRDCERMYP